MGLIYWIAIVVANVALLPSLEARPDDCYDVGGLLVLAITPVGDDGALALNVIPQYAQYLKDNGANGVIVAATTGEGPTLNVSDKKRLLDAWMEAAPPLNLFVISSVGGVPFPDTLEMARYSEELGVDAIFALPEVYYKPRTAEELVYYMELIAEAAPETPLVYDDVPEYTGVRVDLAKFYELATERISTFRGLKSGEFRNLLLLRSRTQGQQKLYVGRATHVTPAVFLGFKNFALAELNFFPRLITQVITSGQKRNLAESTKYYQILVDLIHVIKKKGKYLSAYKETMQLLTGIDMGPVRKPIYPLDDDEKRDLETRLRTYRQLSTRQASPIGRTIRGFRDLGFIFE